MKSSLRTRLFIALLALALVPTLLFAWFTLVQLHAATARWYQSGVERALGAAIETNRTTLTRLEATAIVPNRDPQTLIDLVDCDYHARCLRMLGHVGQGLLHDTKADSLQIGR